MSPEEQESIEAIIPVKQRRLNWQKLFIFLFSILLFLVALELMKAGAQTLSPLIRDTLSVDDVFSGLGFGWVSSYLLLSGSPVAAIGLTLFDTAVINETTAFAMIVGSRMGASMIVLLVGLAYIIQGKGQRTSLLTGVLALLITGSIYIFAFPLGLLIMLAELPVIRLSLRPTGALMSPVDAILNAPVNLLTGFLPEWTVFVIGVLMTVASLNLFDRALPELNLEDNVFGGVNRMLYKPWAVFGLGLIFTMLTMSVSVSLGLLVPLSVRGYIRRENLVPYIMGCNISTFIDTLIAALLLRNAEATDIVLIQIVSILVVSIIILVIFFRPYQRYILRFAIWLNDDQTRMIAFFAFILIVPLLLLFVR